MPLGDNSYASAYAPMAGRGADLSSFLPYYMMGMFGGTLGSSNPDQQQQMMRAMYAQALMRNSAQPAPQTTSPWGAISNAVRPIASAYMARSMMGQRPQTASPYQMSVAPGQTTPMVGIAGAPAMGAGSLGFLPDITQQPGQVY